MTNEIKVVINLQVIAFLGWEMWWLWNPSGTVPLLNTVWERVPTVFCGVFIVIHPGINEIWKQQ